MDSAPTEATASHLQIWTALNSGPLSLCQVGHDTVESGVLGLRLLEALHLVSLHAAVLVALAVEGRLADGQFRVDSSEAQTAAQIDLGLVEQPGSGVCRLPRMPSSLPSLGVRRLSYHLDTVGEDTRKTSLVL
jgi:hypothetical protein